MHVWVWVGECEYVCYISHIILLELTISLQTIDNGSKLHKATTHWQLLNLLKRDHFEQVDTTSIFN